MGTGCGRAAPPPLRAYGARDTQARRLAGVAEVGPLRWHAAAAPKRRPKRRGRAITTAAPASPAAQAGGRIAGGTGSGLG